VEFHGEHLVFLKSDGTLTALFALEIVESWSEIALQSARRLGSPLPRTDPHDS
jgi:hypothetical protein